MQLKRFHHSTAITHNYEWERIETTPTFNNIFLKMQKNFIVSKNIMHFL